MKILFLMAAMILIFPSAGQSGWWLSGHGSTEAERISDEPIEFRVGNMSCGATKTDYIALPDGSVVESRILYCWTAEDTKVSVGAICRYPHYSVQELKIQKGAKYYDPALTCGSEIRSP